MEWTRCGGDFDHDFDMFLGVRCNICALEIYSA